MNSKVRVKRSWDFVRQSEITPEEVFQSRRRLIKALGAGSVSESILASRWLSSGLAVGAGMAASPIAHAAFAGSTKIDELPSLSGRRSKWTVIDAPTPFDIAASYNNFYEFGTDKADPYRYAGSLKTHPWKVVVEGECNKPRTFDLDDLKKLAPMEERIYRFRCVEAWSMIVPWIGYPLSALLKAVEPNSKAKYVQFVSLADPKQMPGVKSKVLDWPYREGLRIDEANHELALLTFGQYGKVLPNQSGAPVRMVLPWKYGFKSAKSIVKIILTEKEPSTSWNMSAPREYGFYSNVNPNVDHPRWSQASERKLGEGSLGGLFAPRRKTEMFNGYADSVGWMYTNMDLKVFY